MYKGTMGDILIDNVLNQAVAEVLKELREEKGLSLQELSNRMGNVVTRQTLSRYELGYSKIRMSVFNKIAKAYNIEPSDLFNRINMRYISKITKYTNEGN